MADGRHILLQAPDEQELNEWISRINYASAFKTAGIRMRALGMSGQEVELTGIAAAASHLKDMKATHKPQGRSIVRRWEGRSSAEVLGSMSPPASPQDLVTPELIIGDGTRASVDLEVPIPQQIESGQQFKATFDRVKADLAAGRFSDVVDGQMEATTRIRSHSLESAVVRSPTSPTASERSGFLSRTNVIQSKIRDLDGKIAAAQTQLDADMRFVRNIALATPFQRTTRDRLQTAVQGVARKIMQVRLDVAKLTCHREVLANDLVAAEQEWKRTAETALRAATKALHDQLGSGLPRMSVSQPPAEEGDEKEESHAPSAPRPIPRGQGGMTPAESRRTSSHTSSFYSAVDHGLDWTARASTDGELGASVGSSAFLEPRRAAEGSAEATPGTDDDGKIGGGSPSYPFPRQDSDELARTPSSSAPGAHERFYTAPEEEAEEWDKTQAGKRVSLVKLPSDLRIGSFFGRARQQAATVAAAPAGSPLVDGDGSVTSRESAKSPRLSPILLGQTGAVAMLDI
jgi:hypothetical protein